MAWSFTDDPDRYAEQVPGLLSARPDANTVALTVLETLRAGQRYSEVDSAVRLVRARRRRSPARSR